MQSFEHNRAIVCDSSLVHNDGTVGQILTRNEFKCAYSIVLILAKSSFLIENFNREVKHLPRCNLNIVCLIEGVSIPVLSESVHVAFRIRGNIVAVHCNIAQVGVRVFPNLTAVLERSFREQSTSRARLLKHRSKVCIDVAHSSSFVLSGVPFEEVRVEDCIAWVLSVDGKAPKVDRSRISESPTSCHTLNLVLSESVALESHRASMVEMNSPGSLQRCVTFKD